MSTLLPLATILKLVKTTNDPLIDERRELDTFIDSVRQKENETLAIQNARLIELAQENIEMKKTVSASELRKIKKSEKNVEIAKKRKGINVSQQDLEAMVLNLVHSKGIFSRNDQKRQDEILKLELDIQRLQHARAPIWQMEFDVEELPESVRVIVVRELNNAQNNQEAESDALITQGKMRVEAIRKEILKKQAVLSESNNSIVPLYLFTLLEFIEEHCRDQIQNVLGLSDSRLLVSDLSNINDVSVVTTQDGRKVTTMKDSTFSKIFRKYEDSVVNCLDISMFSDINKNTLKKYRKQAYEITSLVEIATRFNQRALLKTIDWNAIFENLFGDLMNDLSDAGQQVLAKYLERALVVIGIQQANPETNDNSEMDSTISVPQTPISEPTTPAE